jgi:hypothetical protein
MGNRSAFEEGSMDKEPNSSPTLLEASEEIDKPENRPKFRHGVQV